MTEIVDVPGLERGQVDVEARPEVIVGRDLVEAELQLIHKADERAHKPLDAAERRAELLIGGGAGVATVALWLLPNTGHWSVGALGCVIAMLAASSIRIDVADGYTVPTQLSFLPLIFVGPLADVWGVAPVFVLAAVVVFGVWLGGRRVRLKSSLQ